MLSQSYGNYEIIVVDDGSTDDSANIVKSVSDNRIRLIQQQNKGTSAARNLGITQSRYQYIAFLDADDLWMPDYLAQQAQMIIDFPKARLWGTGHVVMDDDAVRKDYPTGLPKDFRGYIDNYFELKNRISDIFWTSAIVVDKDAITASGLFDSRLRIAEDCDMWFRLLADHPAAFTTHKFAIYNQCGRCHVTRKKIDFCHHPAYYANKYEEYKANPTFYHFIQNWCAVQIKRYYLSGQIDKKNALEASRKLDFSIVPTKYRYLFNLPFTAAKLLEYISTIRKRRSRTP